LFSVILLLPHWSQEQVQTAISLHYFHCWDNNQAQLTEKMSVWQFVYLNDAAYEAILGHFYGLWAGKKLAQILHIFIHEVSR